MSSLLGPALALGAAAVLGTADYAGGVLSKRRSSVVVTGWSHVATFAVLTAVCLAAGLPSSWGWLPWAVVSGACSGLGLVAFYAALSRGTMGVVSPIASLGVLVPVVFGLLRGEELGLLHGVGMAVAIVGVVLAAGPEFRGREPGKGQAVLLASLAALAFGVMTVGIIMGAQSSPLFTQLGMRGTSSAGFLAYALLRRSTGRVTPLEVGKFALLGLTDVAGNLLMAVSGTFGMMAVTAVIVSLYSVVTIALAAVLLGERLRRGQWLGVAAALAGVALMNLT